MALRRALGFAFLMCTVAGGAALALPREVLLLRHGHKDSQRGDYNLSPQGFARAIALGRLLPQCFGLPSQIRTFALDMVTSKNARSYQTAVPLAVATGVNIGIVVESPHASRKFGERLLQNPLFNGGRVVLVWEHRRLPELARGLGWAGMAPIADDDFDQLVRLRYRTSGPPLVERYSQQTLLTQGCPPNPGE